MSTKLRNIGTPPITYVVDPKGRIRHYRCASGIKHRVLQTTRGGDVELSSDGHKEGWALLEHLYQTDPDDEIRARGMDVWNMYNERTGRSLANDPFPEDWLPAEVVARRKRAHEIERAPFQAPKRNKPDPEPEPEKRGPGRPRKEHAE